ncbi:MAG: hypothetical protein ACKV2T_19125 [Kofleriaceae bacterium]
MHLIPNLGLEALRKGYGLRDQAPFDVLGAKLGLDLHVNQLARVLHAVAERDLWTMFPGFARLRHFGILVPWDLSPLFGAMLATNGRTRFTARDVRRVPVVVRDHIDFVRTRSDGTIIRDEWQ